MRHTADLQNDLTKNDFVYTKAGTCITKRWRQMGWVPASEQQEIKDKWARYQAMPSRTLDEVLAN
jgi:hypothetical protein